MNDASDQVAPPVVAGERAGCATYLSGRRLSLFRGSQMYTDPRVSAIYPVPINTTVDGKEGVGIRNSNRTP